MLLSKSLISAIIMCVAATSFADAWGRDGHNAITYLAKELLPPKVQAEVNKIIGGAKTPENWGEAANWADTVRYVSEYSNTASEHYVSIPYTPPTPAPYAPAHCVRNRCLTNAIRFLLHYLNDVNQPLHVISYLGGANGVLVRWNGKASTNLHAVWDTLIPKEVMDDDPKEFAEKWSILLKTPAYAAQVTKWGGCTSAKNKQLDDCVIEWINEGSKDAHAILKALPASTDPNGLILDSKYVAKYSTLVQNKMLATAVRTAGYINKLLAPCATK
ncbi:phospholipase C/P1 nuclease domain-containing protein [Syncephalis fuscata]|nr:phospholipase C/P1 nuclease domain-containing protein [Syncephalis fuscata]